MEADGAEANGDAAAAAAAAGPAEVRRYGDFGVAAGARNYGVAARIRTVADRAAGWVFSAPGTAFAG